MAEWIDINGAKIEKQFLEENVAEAKTSTWKPAQWPKNLDHSHCIICTIAIPYKNESPSAAYYKSEGGWLCAYCYERFMRGQRSVTGSEAGLTEGVKRKNRGA